MHRSFDSLRILLDKSLESLDEVCNVKKKNFYLGSEESKNTEICFLEFEGWILFAKSWGSLEGVCKKSKEFKEFFFGARSI